MIVWLLGVSQHLCTVYEAQWNQMRPPSPRGQFWQSFLSVPVWQADKLGSHPTDLCLLVHWVNLRRVFDSEDQTLATRRANCLPRGGAQLWAADVGIQYESIITHQSNNIHCRQYVLKSPAQFFNWTDTTQRAQSLLSTCRYEIRIRQLY